MCLCGVCVCVWCVCLCLSICVWCLYVYCVVVWCVQNLDLGVRTDGVRVSDVELPPWAKGQYAMQVLVVGCVCDSVLVCS